MKILVTGGAGFIGSHLSEILLKKGHVVFVLDNLFTGKKENINHLLKNPRFFFVHGSVLNKSDLAPLIKKSDQVFHLAAAVGVKLVTERPLESMLINLEGTKNVLELAELRNIPVLITSSSEVYGKNEELPFKEDSDRRYGSVYNERWGYALSKAVDEFMGMSFWRERKLPVVIVRLFNTVGPRQTGQYGMVVPRFVVSALTNAPITVYGTGDQTRAFCYVEDIVNAMTKLINCKKAYGEVINLGSTEAITINNLARKIKSLTGSRSPIVHMTYKNAYSNTFEDMLNRVPNISKAKKLISYYPRYDLVQILGQVIEYHKKTRSEFNSR
ncbi:MAG: GDP-mannose 4,6-dehydratase [Patescibacteria group bacterium]